MTVPSREQDRICDAQPAFCATRADSCRRTFGTPFDAHGRGFDSFRLRWILRLTRDAVGLNRRKVTLH